MNYLICGGAGFIGSNLVSNIARNDEHKITIMDNYSTGSYWYLRHHIKNYNIKIISSDLRDIRTLASLMKGSEIVYHLATHPDLSNSITGSNIANSITGSNIDFGEDLFITQNILEAMRLTGVKRILFASGSSVYGNTGETPVAEDYGPMLPVSLCGASKLACEALICSYCHMFDLQGVAFRFDNVIGPNQSMGQLSHFVNKITQDPKALDISEDENQSESYLYVQDLVSAMRVIEKQMPGLTPKFCCYNVANSDLVSIREIADMALGSLGLNGVEYRFSSGNKHGQGEILKVRLNTRKIRDHGWQNKFTSIQAIQKTITSLVNEAG